jgi:hypothetical protein
VPTVYRHRTLAIAVLAALASCTTTPVATSSSAPVCAFSAVEQADTHSSVHHLAVGWKSGPIAPANVRLLQRTNVSNAPGPADAAEVALPGPPRVVRLIAGVLGAGIPDPRAQVSTAPGSWMNVSGPGRDDISGFDRASATRLGAQVRGCYVSDDGRAFLARPSTSSPNGWILGDIELWDTEPAPTAPLAPPGAALTPGAGRVGPFADISCAGAEDGVMPDTPPTELHVCAVTTDGHIWHTIFNGSTWTPFGDVQQQTSNNGPADAVACAIEGRQLHLVAVVRHSGAWFVEHTIRAPGGAWRAWDSLMFAADGTPFTSGESDQILDVAASFCAADGPMPSGPRETRRLNVAWVTQDGLQLIERSRGPVDWAPGFSGSVSPELGLAPSGEFTQLETVSLAEMPFPPLP